jgi:hypothetical protein
VSLDNGYVVAEGPSVATHAVGGGWRRAAVRARLESVAPEAVGSLRVLAWIVEVVADPGVALGA